MSWLLAQYSYKMSLTVNASQVGSGGVTGFRVLVNTTNAYLKSAANGGYVQSNSGYDIEFSDPTDNYTLAYDLVSYTPSTGALIAWVYCPFLLSSSSSTTFNIYYGNALITSSQANATNVWNPAGMTTYRGVWHTQETSGAVIDSSSYSATAVITGTVTRGSAGPIGNAYAFSGSSGNYISFAQTADEHLSFSTGSFTVSLWLYIAALPGSGIVYTPLWRGGSSSSVVGYDLEINHTPTLYADVSDGTTQYTTPLGAISATTWTHIVLVVNRTTNVFHLYINGAEVSTGTTITGLGSTLDTQSLCFGATSSGSDPLNGRIAEVQISAVAHTPAMITTAYNNQSSPSTFLTFGTQQARPSYSGLTITVSGVQIPVLYNLVSFQIDEKLTQRSTCTFGVSDPAMYYSFFQEYQQVTVTDSVLGLLYVGYIDSVQIGPLPGFTATGATNAQIFTVTCKDKYYIADKRLCSIADRTNIYAGDFVCLIHSYILSQDGVTAKYALGNYQTAADWNTGTLANTSTYSGVLTLAPAGGTSTVTDEFSLTADWARGTLNNLTDTGNELQNIASTTSGGYTGTAVSDSHSLTDTAPSGDQVTTIMTDNLTPVGTIGAISVTVSSSGGTYGSSVTAYSVVNGVIYGTVPLGTSSDIPGLYVGESTAGITLQIYLASVVNGSYVSVSFTISPATIPPYSNASYGTWTSPSKSLASIGTVGNSAVTWNPATQPSNTSVTVYVSVNGGALQTCSNGGYIPGLTPGASAGTGNIYFVIALYPYNYPDSESWISAEITNFSYTITSSFNTSGTWTSPSIPLSTVGNALGSSSISWSTTLPTDTSVVVQTSIDNGATWQTVSTNGAAVAHLTPQPTGISDSFGANTSDNYTITYTPGGSAPAVYWNTTITRLEITGGINGLLLQNQFQSSDVDVYVVTDQSPYGGVLMRVSVYGGSYTNWYAVILQDSTGTSPQTLTIIKNVSNVITTIGGPYTVNFVQGTLHALHASVIGSTLTAIWDGTQIAQITDTSIVNYVYGITGGYGYSQSITISHTMVGGGSNLSNFAVLVEITDANLATVANGGYVQSSNGYDILFTDSTQTVQLTWEIESYNATNGALVAWVKIPTLSASVDTVIYMFFGNALISSFQSIASSVWDSNYMAVYHMNDNATNTTVHDSTVNARNGTAAANTSTKTTTGEIDGALTFNGSSDDITSASFPAPGGTNYTVSAWVYSTNFNQNSIIAEEEVINANWALSFSSGTPGIVNLLGADTSKRVTATLPSNNGWHYVVGVWNGTTGTIYIDGVQAATGTITQIADTSNTLYIGNYSGGAYWFNGKMDEVRISNLNRSAEVIATQYNNQSSPATYLTVGALTLYATTPGYAGFINSTPGTAHWYNYVTLGYGQNVSALNAQVKLSLATTNTLVTPSVDSLIISIRGQNIQAGMLMSGTTYQYLYSTFYAIQSLAGDSGFVWGFTNSSELFFKTIFAIPAPFCLSTTNGDVLIQSPPSITLNSPYYRNKHYIYNCFDVVDNVADSFVGDGVTSTWTTSYPIGSTPTITVNGIEQSVGLQSVDTGTQFVYSPAVNAISQGANQPVLSSSSTIVVTYNGMIPYVAIAQDTAQQALIASYDGTSGIIESSEDGSAETGGTSYIAQNPLVEQTIPTSTAANLMPRPVADQIAQARIDQYAKLTTTLKFSTLRTGLTVGMTITIHAPEFNINYQDNYLITEIVSHATMKSDGTVFWIYDVTAVLGAYIGTWERFFIPDWSTPVPNG